MMASNVLSSKAISLLLVGALALASLRCDGGGGPITIPDDPSIGISETTKSFTGTEGGADPGPQTIAVTNAGEGTLSGLTATVSFGAGEPTGWLSAALSTTAAPSTLTLAATTGSLPAGTYTASVAVSSTVATNSPQTVAVTFTVQPPEEAGATIVLSSASQNFSSLEGGPDPVSQTVDVTNGGGGTLGGLAANATYTSGQPAGWLSATLSETAAPSVLTLAVTTGALTAGTYTANVGITSAAADNSPQTVSVTFTVAPSTAGPIISLSTSTRNFTAVQGGPNPPARHVEISNGGGGTLSGLGTTTTYGSGQPAGWLNASLSATTAPSTLTLTATTGSLAAGTYTASVAVASAVASNSPQTVNVRFTVQPPAATPTIVLSSTSQEFNAVEGGPNPDPQTVEVTNGGGGTLDGLSQNITYIVGSPSDPVDWLTAALSATAAPSTLTLTVATAGLAAGTYRANVFVSSDAASNSAQPVSVVFNVTPQTIPNAPSNLEATVVSTSQIDLQWTDNADNEEGFRVDLCFDPVCGNFSQEVVGPNVTVYESKGLGQATTYHFRVQAFISGGNSAYSEIVSATTLSAWTTKTPMPTPRYLSASGVVDGVLYVVGGLFGELATNEAYNPGNDTWSPKAPIPTPRAGATAAVVNGILYVVGGLRDGVELATVEAYDPLTDDWTTKAPMPTARDGAMAGVVDGIIYVAGGTGEPGTGFLATVEAYDPGTDSWTTVAPLSQGRTFGAVGVVDGILYVAGGDAGGADPATTEAYDPTTDSWTTKAIIPTQRDRVASAVLDGILYVAAGAAGGGSEVLATVEAYDPGTDDWTTKPAMPTAREFPVAGVVNGVLYVVGGRAGNGSALGTVEAYSP